MNALTVDVEDYFQVSAFESVVDRSSWADRPCRIERNMARIIDLLEQFEIKATFFVLGWVAQHYPGIVRELATRGHEIASHGMAHVRVGEQSPREFKQDVTESKDRLEQLVGTPVIGYRAASYSIGRDNLWAFSVLAEAGYSYSSSVYPIVHDLYGLPEAPRFPFRNNGEAILEIPITTVQIAGRKLPCGGGGYFRLLPYAWTKWALNRVNHKDQQTAIFYFHPWEIDPEQPRISEVPTLSRLRHYTNLGRMERKLHRLFADFSWGRVDKAFGVKVPSGEE